MGKDSKVVGKVGYALAPVVKKSNAGWLWAWSLAIESSSKNKEAAFKFLTWATSKEYVNLVGQTIGWAQVPPGTRESTYTNPNYLKAAPFAKQTIAAIKNANYEKPTIQEVPYVGVQYVSIPEFQNLGDQVAQQLAAYLSGKQEVDETLKQCQSVSNEVATEGGYQK
jgi:ABC-type sugar transport system, periplasmic component